MGGEQPERIDRAVDPQIVRIDDEEGIGVDQGQRPDQPAAGLQQLIALVGDSDLKALRPVPEMRLERVGEIMDVDHDLLDARRAEPVEAMVEQRLAGHLDQRLGPGRGQRAHALAEPGGHHHRGLRHLAARHRPERERTALAVHAAAASAQAAARFSAGTCESNQARTGASAGWARLRSR